jgi:GNAT superfamily N-acetyltransferase
MTVTFQKEPFWQALHDAEALLPRHFEEIAEDKAINGAPDPDIAHYAALSERGALHTLTARDDGRLVGYYVAIVTNNKHYRTVINGLGDLHYLLPEYRKGRVGIQLLIEAERMMREAGAMVGITKVKLAHDHGPILERLGWRPFERVYAKVLV